MNDLRAYKNKWRKCGIIYFIFVFVLVPSLASAYIDPSVTTYAIQAFAGVAVAIGAFFATYGRRLRNKYFQMLGIDTGAKKQQKPKLVMTREDLKEELELRRNSLKAVKALSEKPKKNGRILTSLILGIGFSITVSLRPIISFYYSNEGEFWFGFGDVIWFVLLFFAGLVLAVGLVHFFLPESGRVSLRLLFATLVCAGTICVFVQNHFMKAYLPVLTGEPINWSQYAGWGTASIVLWIGVFAAMTAGAFLFPRSLKAVVYSLMILVLFTEVIIGGLDLTTATHETEEEKGRYFSREGIFDTSTSGNIVVIVSDTFEGTYLNEILEQYPEYKEMLPEVTYYNNMTGISCLTYLSYSKLLTGIDFKMGKNEHEGIRYAFENSSLTEKILSNGWEITYYSDFSPVPELKGKIVNYSEGEIAIGSQTAWRLAKMLWKSTLFQSAPQQIKDKFLVYTYQYENVKNDLSEEERPLPYTEDDQWFYWTMKDNGLRAVKTEKPRYTLIQLWGLHEPSVINQDFVAEGFDDSVSLHERKLYAGRAMLKMLRQYLDYLKEEGTYDNTTVIMTADHGFNMRYYPVFLVKEAGSGQKEFRTDDTPLSLQEDFEPLVTALTAGNSFSQAVKKLNISEDRVRYALDFRADSYGDAAKRRTVVKIRGEAKDPQSYYIEKDEFLVDDGFKGRCYLGIPFISGSEVKDTVAVYGYNKNGHSLLFDAFFNEIETRRLQLRTTVKNITENEQRIIISLDGQTVMQTVLTGKEEKEITVPLPEKTGNRWTIELDTPDAIQDIHAEKVLGWVSYSSINVSEAVLEEYP